MYTYDSCDYLFEKQVGPYLIGERRTLNYTTRAATFSSPQLLFTLAVSAERARDLYADINPACLTRNLVLPF